MPTEEEMEKLKNMSPEEIIELQKQQCIFCHIIKGEVASKKVYDDEKCIAILDINPANPGHVLILPKEHYVIMPVVPEDIIKHIFMVAKHVSAILLKALQAQGTSIFVANGAVAGQKAQHFMIHVIPRMEKDNLNFNLPEKDADEKVLESLRKKLYEKISRDLKIGIEEIPNENPGKPKEKKTVKKEEKAPVKKAEKSKKPKIVEAEFKEKAKKPKQEKKKKAKKEEEVGLDDIADLFSGKV